MSGTTAPVLPNFMHYSEIFVLHSENKRNRYSPITPTFHISNIIILYILIYLNAFSVQYNIETKYQ